MSHEVKAATVDRNGDVRVSIIRIGVAILALVVAMGAAVTPALLAMGRVGAHIQDSQRHESASEKEARIDDRVDLHMKPIDVRLENMDEKIDELKRLMQAHQLQHSP
jgi:TolA-binding protein